MLEQLVSVGDTLLRIPLLLFIDLVASKRVNFVYSFVKRNTENVTWCHPMCLRLDDFSVTLLIAVVLVACAFIIFLHTKGVIWASCVLFNSLLIWFAFENHRLLINVITYPSSVFPTHVTELVSRHLVIHFLISLFSFLFLFMQSHEITLYKTAFIAFLFLSIPFLSLLPITSTIALMERNFSSNSIPSVAGPNNHTTVFLTYANLFMNDAYCVSPVCSSRICLNSDNPFHLKSSSLKFLLQPYATLCANIFLQLICFKLTHLCRTLLVSFTHELEVYRVLGFFEFLTIHWNRLNVPQVLSFFWILKLVLVIILGPTMWPLVSSSEDPSVDHANISTLVKYIDTGSDPSTVSVLITRLFIGSFVHGSETWISVFGAASFFGGLATLFVSFLVFLLDPTGNEMAQLAMAAADAAPDPHAWNVIDDPALALDRNDVIAVELLSSTGWNCAVVFLFLAFQSDLPTLPSPQRIYCFIYGLMVIVITCIHSVKALNKSLLLRLGVPGRETSWGAHIRPLCFCLGLIFAAFGIFSYIPDMIAYHNTNSTLSIIITNFSSSEHALKARQLRIFLSGCQLLLGLVVILIEYFVYQVSRRNPVWAGFRPTLFWVILISSITDYLLSLLGFLTVCWLVFYDSIGICRLLIICSYFGFVLYPSAQRAYTWVRWRFLFKKCLDNLPNPSLTELESLGDICPICYSEMTPQSAKITRCGHLYHTECLEQWMHRQLFCPFCHADLLSSSVSSRRVRPNQQPQPT